MALLFNDTFTDVNGTLITAHPADTGQAWAMATGTAVPLINSTNDLYYAASTTGNAQAGAITAPSGGTDYAIAVTLVRRGALTASQSLGGFYMNTAADFSGGVNTDAYGIGATLSGTAGDVTWNIRRANLSGAASTVFATSVAASYFPSVGAQATAVLSRRAITGGFRLTLYVNGVQLLQVDDTTASQVARVGQPMVTNGGANNTGAATGVKLTQYRAANIAANVAPPSISGTAQAGQTLTAAGDTWSDVPFTVAYQWQQDLGAGFVDIAGATGTTYLVQPGDVGHPLRVTATASGPGGVASASSSSITPTGAPTLVPSDIEVQLSGGTSNADPRLSIGGPRGAVRVVDPADASGALVENLLPRVLGPAAQSGQTDYVLIYLHNKHAVYGADLVAWIATQPSSASEHLAIGAPTQPAGQDVPAVATNVTAPAGVTFSAPADAGSGVALGTVPPGSYRGLWIRRVTDPSAPQSSTPVTFELRVTVTQV